VYTNINASTSATLVGPSTGIYAAGTGSDATSHANTYYTNISVSTAFPTSQTNSTLSGATNQTGTVNAGGFAFKWREVILRKTGSGTGTTNISWYIDGVRIASVTNAFTPANGTNISLGYFDAF